VFVWLYHAERVLSAIDKFLIHLLGEGEGRGEMGKERGRGRVGRKWGGYGDAGNGNARKK